MWSWRLEVAILLIGPREATIGPTVFGNVSDVKVSKANDYFGISIHSTVLSPSLSVTNTFSSFRSATLGAAIVTF